MGFIFSCISLVFIYLVSFRKIVKCVDGIHKMKISVNILYFLKVKFKLLRLILKAFCDIPQLSVHLLHLECCLSPVFFL